MGREQDADNESATDAVKKKNKQGENHRLKRVSKNIFKCYLVCSRTPVALAGLVPCTPSQRDGRARLLHSEVVQQSQLCSGFLYCLEQQKKCISWTNKY